MAVSIFVSLDGMTDPLGQSQVLPYLQGLSSQHQLILVSAEKPDRYQNHKNIIEKICKDSNINWHPVIYNTGLPLISQIFNFLKLLTKTYSLTKKNRPQIIHTRSYVPAFIALLVSLIVNVKILFDMRGFWANERIDGGIWKLNSLKGRILYNFFKRIEKSLISRSSAIVTLTQAAKEEIESWIFYNKNTSITVIPCCVDVDHFNFKNLNTADKEKWQHELNINNNSDVVTYLGSVGTWYMLPEMLAFFKEQLVIKPNSVFLFITAEPKEFILKEARKIGISENNLRIVFGKRADVPALLSLSTYSLFFIKPLYSKKGSSPTKLAELLAMGIPVIANGNVGDMNAIFKKDHCGLLVNEFNTEAYKQVLQNLNQLKKLKPDELRNICLREFSLSLGVERYKAVYKHLLQ